MICRISYKRINAGFSLVELMIVLGIFSLFAVVTGTLYTDFRSGSNLEIAAGSVVEAMRHAKANAEQVQGDSKWGVKIFSDEVVVFEGANYDTRNIDSDHSLYLPNSVSTGGLSEIVFEKVSGATSTTGTATISNGNTNKNISINAKGTITY